MLLASLGSKWASGDERQRTSYCNIAKARMEVAKYGSGPLATIVLSG